MRALPTKPKPLQLGTNSASGNNLELAHRWLSTHLHVIGPTGEGKSRVLLHMFQQLCRTNRPIILPDFKGDLFTMARDWALSHGYTKRLVLIDLSADMLPGYNPLRENGMRIDLQAQWVSEGVKSAWGQTTFDETPQLARMLYLCLYVARALKLSLADALDVLRPYPALRERALMRIEDRFVHGALLAFEQLNDRRKEELAASTLARLEGFCQDEIVRKVICSPQSLDLETLLSQRKIVLLNFAKCQPLLPDRLKLLARMFTSDLLAHVYKGYGEGKFNKDHPVYFMCDEVQNMATRQLCDILDQGRGIGLHCILAHQHLSQLALEDESGYLLRSVMNDARTKIIFGDLDYEDLEVLVKNVMLDRYNFWPTEDQLGKTVRRMITRSLNHSKGKATAWPSSETVGEAESVARGTHRDLMQGTNQSTSDSHAKGGQLGVAVAKGNAQTLTDGTNGSTSTTRTRQEGRSVLDGESKSEESKPIATHSVTNQESDSTANTETYGWQQSKADTSSLIVTLQKIISHMDTHGTQNGSSQAATTGDSEILTKTKNRQRTHGETPSESEEWGASVSQTLQPLSVDEQTILFMQTMKNIPERHFLLKIPRKSAFIVAALDVKEPWIGKNQLHKGLGHVYANSFYFPRDEPKKLPTPVVPTSIRRKHIP